MFCTMLRTGGDASYGRQADVFRLAAVEATRRGDSPPRGQLGTIPQAAVEPELVEVCARGGEPSALLTFHHTMI